MPYPISTSARSEKVNAAQKFSALIRLTRWREHVPYTIPNVLSGALIAVYINQITPDWRLVPVLVANILTMAFAFMINDVEDAPDDALDPPKKAHNVISQGIISQREGALFGAILFAIALILYVFGGWKTFGTGGLTLVLCYLYSAPPFRLKAHPIVDVVSHGLMLSGLVMLSGYLIYDTYPGKAWFMFIAVTMGSAYGQFYNQLDDYAIDKEVGLRNTAIMIGETATRMAMNGSILIGVTTFLIAVWLDCFPAWLGPILIVVIFTLSLFRWNIDMRGSETTDAGMIQTPTLVAGNIMVLIWLIHEMGILTITLR